MDLVRTGNTVTGTYYYDRWYPDGAHVPITGTITGNRFVLQALYPAENMNETFEGLLDFNCAFQGTWKSLTLHKSHFFNLRMVNAEIPA